MKKNNQLFWGGLLIILGGILLLNNLGFLDWNIWTLLVKLWPLIFVLAGLEMFFGSSNIAEFILSLIILLVVFYLIIQFISTGNPAFRLWIYNNIPWVPLRSTNIIPFNY